MKFIGLLSLALLVFQVSNLRAQNDSTNWKAINLGPGVNSTAIEINPRISADGKTLYYVREQHDKNVNHQDIWVSEQDENGKWKEAIRLEKPLNTGDANSVASVSINGNELFIKGFYKKGKYTGRGYSVSNKTKEGWAVPQGLHIENYNQFDKGKYNNACISNDDKVMIFSFCEYEEECIDNDLYVSFRKMDEKFSSPVKIMGGVSEKGAFDFAPFLASDNKTLYFASDRPGGLGASDIYKTERLDSTWLNWSQPVNMGDRINSTGRDSYYSIDARGEFAYILSDKNSLGFADIVMIELEPKQKPKPVVLVKGNIYDAKTKKPIDGFLEYHEFPEALVKGKEHSDPSSGKYSVIFPYGEKFVISAHAHAYVSSYDTISFSHAGSEYQEIIRDFYLTPIIKGEKVVLNHVNFETNSIVFEEGSFSELNKVVEFLLQNEEVEIMIGGHTDHSGEVTHNKKLSENRAKAVMDYILSKGIPQSRVSAKGFGEDQPVVPNDSPENMRKNRRVEFTIIKE